MTDQDRVSSLQRYYADRPRRMSSPFYGGDDSFRAEFLTDVLAELGLDLRGKYVLDVGCGKGYLRQYCLELNAQYRGVDITPRALEIARGAVGGQPHWFVLGNAERLPFADAAFDLLFCIDVFEHIPDQASAACDFARVLRRGGSVFLSIPNYSNTCGVVKRLEEAFGKYAANTWSPFGDGWEEQVLEQFMTPRRVRQIFSKAGFGRFRMIGDRREMVVGLFPWLWHRGFPAVLRLAINKAAFPLSGPLNYCLPALSLHNYWRFDR